MPFCSSMLLFTSAFIGAGGHAGHSLEYHDKMRNGTKATGKCRLGHAFSSAQKHLGKSDPFGGQILLERHLHAAGKQVGQIARCHAQMRGKLLDAADIGNVAVNIRQGARDQRRQAALLLRDLCTATALSPFPKKYSSRKSSAYTRTPASSPSRVIISSMAYR